MQINLSEYLKGYKIEVYSMRIHKKMKLYRLKKIKSGTQLHKITKEKLVVSDAYYNTQEQLVCIKFECNIPGHLCISLDEAVRLIVNLK